MSKVPLYTGLSRDAMKQCGQAPVDVVRSTGTLAARLYCFTFIGPALKPGRMYQGASLMGRCGPIGPYSSPICPLNG